MAVSSIDLNHDLLNNQKTKSSSIFLTKCNSIDGNEQSDFGIMKTNGYNKINWSNGEYFEGFFDNGQRCKVGLHKWGDGDEYLGEYYRDKRHGWGRYKWFNGDCYEGTFYNDTRHGYGRYICANGDEFIGIFWLNQRDGYGTLKYSNGNIFQGLYKDNYRCGPGIMYYEDGSQDIGLWYRNSLFKLLNKVPDLFTLNNFQELIETYKYSQYDDGQSNVDSSSPIFSDKQPINVDRRYSTISLMNISELSTVCRYKLTKPKELELLEELASEPSEQDLEDDIVDEETSQMVEASKQEDISIIEKEVTVSIKEDSKRISNRENSEDLSKALTIEEQPEIQSEMIVCPNLTIEEVEAKEPLNCHKDDSRKIYIQYDETFMNYINLLKLPSNMTSVIEKIFNHILMNSPYFPHSNELAVVETLVPLRQVFKDVLSSIFESDIPKINVRNTKYQAKGAIETKSNQLLKLSNSASIKEVEHLFLTDIPPNVNVTDSRGSFSLLEATLTWDTSLINFLLDKGANINQITDEGVSALGGCLLFYYPQRNFIYTIAESCITLSTTPLNYNGVRREHTVAPHSQTNVNKGGDEQLVLESIKEEVKERSEEDWNSYQNYLIDDIISHSDQPAEDNTIVPTATGSNEFFSNRNCIEFPVGIKDKLLQKAASILSSNQKIIKRQSRPSSSNQNINDDEGKARFLAMKIARVQKMLETIQLLLKRGADPNKCLVPFGALFFTVKSGDVEMTKLLIGKGADVNTKLTVQNGSLSPLHIAVCLPGNMGLTMTQLLLESGADANYRSAYDESFLDPVLSLDWNENDATDQQLELLGGRSPLHMVCARYDNPKICHKICRLLLEYKANPNFICNGHTALTLSIATGNDLITNELLSQSELIINLPLTHGTGTALCMATNVAYEHTKSVDQRLALLRKLVAHGADMVAPVQFSSKRIQGTAVDYAYYIFNMDQRVAHLPYHALTTVERELFNNRRSILSHIGMFIREAAVEKEKARLQTWKLEGVVSRGPSPDFVYTGAGADPKDEAVLSTRPLSRISSAKQASSLEAIMQASELLARKPMFKYCYECGRSSNVKLTTCTRCKEVFFCSKLCKTNAWNLRHKFECLRVGGRPSTVGQSNKNRSDSPTPATIAEDANQFNLNNLKKSQLNPIEGDKTKNLNRKSDPYSFRKRLPTKLPPINAYDHPSYSYAYIMGQYVKIDNFGRFISLTGDFFDNYSFE